MSRVAYTPKRQLDRELVEFKAAELGHTLGEWEPGGISATPRATCTTCGDAVLVTSHAYGSAVERRCAGA